MRGLGYSLIEQLERLTRRAEKMGFVLGHPRHGSLDCIAVRARDSQYPIYSRDAELFVGDLRDVEAWLQGVEWSRNYLTMIKATSDKTVARREQDYRNNQLVQTLKQM